MNINDAKNHGRKRLKVVDMHAGNVLYWAAELRRVEGWPQSQIVHVRSGLVEMSANASQLSEYELQRQENIARNKAFLAVCCIA